MCATPLLITFNRRDLYNIYGVNTFYGAWKKCEVQLIEYRSDDVIKMKFVKLWDLLSYSERTTSKTPTRQKLAIRGKLSLRY